MRAIDMDRVAVFVDAGYLFAQGSVAISGQKEPRESIILDATAAVTNLKELAGSRAPSCELLRIYWYDGARFGSGLTTDHATLAHLDDVKLRLGFVNNHGQQKGVDSLIVTDLIELARLKSITDAILLSGDEDVRVGVQIAQNYGVRVHLIGIHPSRGSQSRQLQQEADTTIELDAKGIQRFLSISAQTFGPPRPVVAPSSSSVSLQSALEPLTSTVANFVQGLNPHELDGVQTYWKTNRGVPPDLDRKLLPICGQAVERRLDPHELKFVRSEFQKRVRAVLDMPPTVAKTEPQVSS